MNSLPVLLLKSAVNFILDFFRDGVRKRPLVWLASTAVTFLLIGWMVLGWLIAPVEYVNPGYAGLPYGEQANYVLTVSDLYAFTRDGDRVKRQLEYWGGDRVACVLSTQVEDPFQQIRLQAAAYATTGKPCVVMEEVTTVGGE